MEREPKEKPSELNATSVGRAMDILENNFRTIVTVTDWSRKLEYKDPLRFTNDFRKALGVRPQPILLKYRALKIAERLKLNKQTKYSIARNFNLRDEKGLYQFIKLQTGYSPNEICELPEQDYENLVKKLESKIIE